jgi:hypothetical protein
VLEKLFIVIGEKFLHGKAYLNLPKDQARSEIQLSARDLLVALDEDNRRWPGMKPVLVEILEQHPSGAAFILGHLRCFNQLNWYDARSVFTHIRLPQGEEELRVALLSKDLPYPEKIEVYGLHFEEGTPVSSALELVTKQPTDLVRAVTESLAYADPSSLFNKVSAMKHRIIRIFLPLDLKLQIWAHDENVQLKHEIELQLDDKIQEAQKMISQIDQIVRAAGREPQLEALEQDLNPNKVRQAAQGADTFHEWVNNLDHDLDVVRRALT